ncbi:NAD-dependent epimerase/dehydratase family protein [Glutamicibacter sp.]|uniref:NAD-dependent epimerase/dehydratase family protein n=1 Tax=Glutamicibacter sp. TaxID=1931995 RepID=UPI0028BE59D0|nr:NAD-dependent epimerase/dehydratase family protein [Glutamicibacter sp.]
MQVLLVSAGDVAIESGLRFVRQGYEVEGWRRNSSKLPAEFKGQDVDLLNPSAWPVIDESTEFVVFTPVPAARTYEAYTRSYLEVAQELVQRLSVQAPTLKRIIYVSSSAVSGGGDGEWIDEGTEVAPNRATSEVLAATERVFLDSGLPVTVLRASGIYGPGRNHLIDQVRDGSARMPLDSHWTNRIHRDDLAQAIVHVATLGNASEDVYMVTDDEPAQIDEIYTFLAEQLRLPIPPQATEQTVRRAANRRIRNDKLLATGFELQFPGFREGYRSVLAGDSIRHR